MKRLTAILLLMTMLLTCLPVLAEGAWTCGSCGKSVESRFCPDCGTMRPAGFECRGCGFKSENTFKFCPECGLRAGGNTSTPTPTATPKPTKTPTPKPVPTPTPKPSRVFEITGVTTNAKGGLDITWTDSANKGPYTILYERYVSPDITSKEQQAQIRWTDEVNVRGSNWTLDYTVPGESYWILIRDAEGGFAVIDYCPGAPKHFPDFPVKITMEYRRAKGSQISQISTLSAQTIASSSDAYGAYVRLDYSQLARERHYVGRVAIASPDGTVLAVGCWDDFELPSGRSNTYWNMYYFDTAFANAQTMYGYIPSGEWTWSLYFDDMFVSSTTFTVAR